MSEEIQKKNRKELCEKLKTRLEILSKDPHEKYAHDYFDFVSWAESKVKNKSFAQIIKEKYQAG